mmetsp:Transcript_69049/g.133272  ORF Transcript_69049/g.133272 Transcript_69049/m.133272 type:complete len:170 (+) Transcript_69049:725-1234(+)
MRFASATGLCGNGCAQFARSRTIQICFAVRCAKLNEGPRRSWSMSQEHETRWRRTHLSQQRQVGQHLVGEQEGPQGHQGEEGGTHPESHEIGEDHARAVGCVDQAGAIGNMKGTNAESHVALPESASQRGGVATGSHAATEEDDLEATEAEMYVVVAAKEVSLNEDVAH